MTIQLDNKIESYVIGLNELQNSFLKNNPQWLSNIRSDSIKNFSKLGFPTLSDEDWRFTNLAPITRNSFKIVENGASSINQSQVAAFSFRSLDCHQLVFVNGRFASELSSVGETAEGLIIKNVMQ